MGGAVVHHATIPENARQLFYQTWPGWTCRFEGKLAENQRLAFVEAAKQAGVLTHLLTSRGSLQSKRISVGLGHLLEPSKIVEFKPGEEKNETGT
jgi:hypothetical protein